MMCFAFGRYGGRLRDHKRFSLRDCAREKDLLGLEGKT